MKQDVIGIKKDVEMLRHKTSEISQELIELMELKDEAAELQTEQSSADAGLLLQCTIQLNQWRI